MRTTPRWLWFEMDGGAELSGTAAIAAIQAGKVDLQKGQHSRRRHLRRR
jgi:hypothetical protein